MKKVLIAFAMLFVMSGCDSKTDTLSCTNTTTTNGLTTLTTYDIDYVDDDVKHVTITYDYSQEGTTTDDEQMDGLNADTDGMDTDATTDDGNLDSDDVVDGVVGDVIDGTINGVTDTILDIAGIRNTYENQFSIYDNIEGFSYNVDVDNDNKYRVIYEIDMDKISDNNLATFNVTRGFKDIRSNYEDLGYTCK